MDTLLSMRIFCRIVEAGSFSAAADNMECSKASVSRAVSLLENHLRTRLLQRTTRCLSLTEPGQRYYAKCKQILAELDDAEAEACGARTRAQGTLRVHCSPDLGVQQVMQSIVEYRRQYPSVKVNVRFLPGTANLIEDGVDVSILSAPSLPDSGNVSRKVGEFERILVASPDYLRSNRIATFADVDAHALMSIPKRAVDDGQPAKLSIVKLDSREAAGPLLINDVEATRFATLAGAGVAALPLHCVSDDIREGRLVHLFPEHRLESASVFAVYASRQYVHANIRTFVDFLSSHLSVALRPGLPSSSSRPTLATAAFRPQASLVSPRHFRGKSPELPRESAKRNRAATLADVHRKTDLFQPDQQDDQLPVRALAL